MPLRPLARPLSPLRLNTECADPLRERVERERETIAPTLPIAAEISCAEARKRVGNTSAW
jgi:hypothetical protein